MALVEVPEPVRGLGITVMCGPFFSVMPFPPRGLHTLSHVRYTPHEAWSDAAGARRRAGPVRPPWGDRRGGATSRTCSATPCATCRPWAAAATSTRCGRSRRSCRPARRTTAGRS
jgi:hypothetical protein